MVVYWLGRKAMYYKVWYKSRSLFRRKHVRTSLHMNLSTCRTPEQFRRQLVAEYGRTNKRVLWIEVYQKHPENP